VPAKHGNSPAIAFIVVLLPAPLWPKTAVIFPPGTSIDTPWTTGLLA
jgi:hypothetical protein